MDITIPRAKNIMRLKYISMFLVAVLLILNGCSYPEQDNVLVSGNNLSLPLPASLVVIDASTLIVEVVDGGTVLPCGGLTVDQVAHTFSCNITLSEGAHSISLKYYIKDATYGVVPIQTTSAISITVVAGTTTTADFSSVTVTPIDSDGDTINNLDELIAGTNPFATCKLGTSKLGSCTLG